MKIIILLLMPIVSFAGYMAESDIKKCGSNRPSFYYKAECKKTSGESCLKIPKGYDCNYFKIKVTKSEVESCIDDDDCQSKLEAKVCTDPDEKAIKVLDDPKEVYCTKTHVAANQGLKTAYEAQKASEDAAKKSKRDEVRITIKDKLKANQDPSAEELRKILLHLLGE